jgi:NTE family protein
MKSFLYIFIFLFQLTGYSQNQSYKNLVMEGGGVRGIAYTGALEVLDSLGILKNIERVGGTSAGAITATMLAIGYAPHEMTDIISHLPLKDFNDGSITGGISRLRYKFGFYKGQKISDWIDSMIKKKTGNADFTFSELHELKKQKHYKDLYITGTDLSYRCLRVFSYESYPTMKIRDALRISFSIPLYYEPLRIDNSGHVVDALANENYHLMIDGGLLSNYPIDIFDSPHYFPCDSLGDCRNRETLGLLLEKPAHMLTVNSNYVSLPIETLTDYVKAMYQTSVDRPNPDKPGLKRTIAINDLGLTSRVRKLSAKTMEELIESGRNGVRIFFLGY